MELTEIRELYRRRGEYMGREVTIGGWVRSNRDSKNFGFLMINDGTFFEPLQVVYGEALENFGEICRVNVGAALIVPLTIRQGEKRPPTTASRSWLRHTAPDRTSRTSPSQMPTTPGIQMEAASCRRGNVRLEQR